MGVVLGYRIYSNEEFENNLFIGYCISMCYSGIIYGYFIFFNIFVRIV